MNQAQNIKLSGAKAAGAKIAKLLQGGEILALIGPLGAGKTTFVKALGKALNIRQKIISPTFTLMRVLPFKLKGRQLYLYHLDLYRLRNFRDVRSLGLTEVWGRPETVAVIEWADKIKTHLPKKTRYIYFI